MQAWWSPLFVSLLAASSAWGAGRLSGHARFERIKGQPAAGHIELYETNLFLSPSGPSPIGPSRRLGTTCPQADTCETILTHDGCYCIDGLPAGTYSILINQPLFYVAPRVVPNVAIADGVALTVHPEPGLDFSCFFKNDWVGNAGSPPAGTPWYQTFVATGRSIRGIAFSCAATPAGVEVAVLRDNGDPNPANWTFVGQRVDPTAAPVTDNWVRFRSGDIPTIPGTRYAVRLSGAGGPLQPYKRNKDALSYTGGQAHDPAGAPQPFDLNITVFSDNDGTRVTMNKRTKGGGELRDGNFASRWGQTFTAGGSSLAGVDLWAAGGNHQWNLDFSWRVREGGPTGAVIGPTKITQAASQSSGLGLHGVSYNPEEVPLVPGQVYFIEVAVSNPPPDSPGFNPLIMDNDSYDGGHGWIWNGSAFSPRPADDLSMTVLEYDPGGPYIRLAPAAIARTADAGTNLPSETFSIQNAGGGLLEYTVSVDAPWLAVSPPQGSNTGESDVITIDYNTAGLAIGTHVATVSVAAPGAVNTPRSLPVTVQVVSVRPDFDKDRDVDQADFAHLQRCLSGPGVPQNDPACQDADLDGDADVDAADFERFLLCVSGPELPADAGCDDG